MKVSTIRGYLLLFLALTFAIACKQPRNVQAKKMNMDALEFEIFVTPARFQLADVEHVTVELRVRNTGIKTVNASQSSFQLFVNGESNMAWGLAGNGIQSTKWSALPPGQSISRSWNHLAAAFFHAAGTYELQLSRIGKMAPVVTVVVE
jgi:hypothetical protein